MKNPRWWRGFFCLRLRRRVFFCCGAAFGRTLDHGDVLERPRSEGGDIKPRQASCGGKPTGAQLLGTVAAAGYRNGGGRSADGTLVWSWTVDPKGARHFLAQLWTGNKFETVVDDQVKGE